MVFFYLASRPVAQLTIDGAAAESWIYLTTDHLGTPMLATDEAGTVSWEGGFEPFGTDYHQGTMAGASENGIFLRLPRQWDDGTWDEASSGAKVYHNVHRWLEPQTGRYNRPDPLGLDAYRRFKFDSLPPSLLYIYADNDPLGRFDSLGLKVEVCARPADLPVIGALGLPHKWIKTDTRSGGMGRANGEVPGQGQCDCPGIPTAVVDHSTESGPDITCMEVEDVDEEVLLHLVWKPERGSAGALLLRPGFG